MIHKQKLLEAFKQASFVDDIKNIPFKCRKWIDTIVENVFTQKGVYTVLITLIVHKIIDPSQDIRYHQSNMKGGFSGRSIDTQEITPTLKQLGLPSMAESGWLTRSLEQPYPYTLDYNGHINNQKVKEAFLKTIDFIEKNPNNCKEVLRLILNKVIKVQTRETVRVIPLENPEKLTIEKVIDCLNRHFNKTYNIAGGSKLPVLAFYAIYEFLIDELKRYEKYELSPLGSHTASDRTSKTAGDIEVLNDEGIYEAIEIKFNREIDSNILRIAYEKIARFNAHRYYILSDFLIKEDEKNTVLNLIKKVKREHGCQIIINGVLQTIKYYLRLISSLDNFINRYSELVCNDKELKRIHKESWNNILKKFLI